MSRTDQIRQIIAEQRGRGLPVLEDFINLRARDSTEQERREALEFCQEIIEAVPLILDKVREAADERGFRNWVEPLVAQAEDYFLEADDLLPESSFGEFGLLDDAYLAMRIVSLVHSDPPLLELGLDGAIDFVRQLLGAEALAMLDPEVDKARERMYATMKQIQEAARRRAEMEREEEMERRRAKPEPPPPPARSSPSPDRQQCGACSGSGRVTCSSCYGQGSHTQSYSRVDWEGNVEYVTENIPCGCSGGYTACGSCGGSGWK